MPAASNLANTWFAARGWKPFAFQRQVWAAVGRGESGLVHASTGTGKTYAVWLAALRAFATPAGGRQPAALQVLWITPCVHWPLIPRARCKRHWMSSA